MQNIFHPLMGLKRFSRHLIPVALGSIVIIALSLTKAFEPLELIGYDTMMRTRIAQHTHKDIVIIEIADDTLKNLGRWPLPRNYHTLMVKALKESKASAIVFDILFSEQTSADEPLAREIREAGNVFLPCAFEINKNTLSPHQVPQSGQILGGVPENFRNAAKGIGHINITVDPDGKARRAPLLVRHGESVFPALGLLVAAQRLGYAPNGITASPGKIKIGAGFSVPVNAFMETWINYPGPWTQTFKHYSYVDILKAYTAKQSGAESWLDLSVLKDKICFIGLTATGTSDLRATPFDALYPLVGAQASLCDSVLRRDFVFRPNAAVRIVIALLLFLAALHLCQKFAPAPAFLGCIALGILYFTGAWLLFNKEIFLDIFLPLVTIMAVYAAGLFHKFLQEAQKRKILEKELEIAASIQRSFLPPEIKLFSGVKIRTFLKPAKFIGGDLYDLIILDEATLGVFIGDVSGKGVSAALIMAQAISLLRIIAQRSKDPARVLAELNNHLVPILKGRFITGQYIVIHTKEKRYEGACAGHPSFILVRQDSDKMEAPLPASGPPLGIMPNISYTTIRQELSGNNKIFMYTDGWTESRNFRGMEFGLERLTDAFFSVNREDIDKVFEYMLGQHDEFEKTSQHDDLTAVLLEI